MRFLELREEEGFRLNVERLTHEMKQGVKCILLCNPNNPTSTLVSKEEMQWIAEFASLFNTTVIVDEAFIELTEGGTANSVTSLVSEYDNLFAISAFTKVFAAPGLRLGYGLGNETLVAGMRQLQQPWPVNTFAACAGDFLPRAGEYLQRTQAWLTVEKDWLFHRLNTIPGLTVFAPQTNFLLAKLAVDGLDAAKLRESLARRGILIRDASNFRFLDQRFFRVAVRDRTSNQCLVEALRSLLK